MPLSPADTATDLTDETSLNPDKLSSPAVVHITLVMDGISFDASDFYNALDTSTGMNYGTVISDKDRASRGCYIFRVSA